MERVRNNMHEDKRTTRVICSRDHRNNQTSPERLGNNNNNININNIKTRLNNNSNNVVMKATFKKVQIVYYISRNGHLQHPHYIEVSHLAHQHLRLKDVLDRLTVLRGKGMPSLYSWSCKRSYKNGYVWNDLAQNDVVYPSEGAEYVLKASELLLPPTEKLHHLQIGNAQEFQFGGGAAAQDASDVHPKRKSLPTKRQDQYHQYEEENVAAEDEEYEAGKTVVHTRCSTGVSTEEIEELKPRIPRKNTSSNNNPTEINLDANSFSSPPSTTSPTLSDHSNNEISIIDNGNNIGSKRFVVEDGDPVGNEPMLSRNSMLFSLIACGGSGPSFRKTAPPLPPTPPRKSGGSLHRGVVCKAAAAARVAVEDEEDEEVVMIKYMSENPRFGNMQSEEKEYFSGSIVESITTEERLGGPGLKKSSSYNQERSKKCGIQAEEEAAAEEEVKKEKGIIGKCMPRKKSSSSKNPKK